MKKETKHMDREVSDATAIAEEVDEGEGEPFEASLRRGTHAKVARILVAEDDDAMRELVALALRFDGHEVHAARDGWELIRKLEALEEDGIEPDLVITDVRMPGVTGLEAVAALDWPRWSVPFIVISAFGGRDLHERAFRLGASAFLDKPFRLEALREIVRGILRSVR
ncbi:MAG TPA: response regulator [Planctomycetota bacterium]|nr:response regulator [Planctomycetota bacterium]